MIEGEAWKNWGRVSLKDVKLDCKD